MPRPRFGRAVVALAALPLLAPVAAPAHASTGHLSAGHISAAHISAGHASTGHATSAARKDPRFTRKLYVDPTMQGAVAADQDSTFDPIGDRAQPMWLTEGYSTDTVQKYVSDYVNRAIDAQRTPTLAVYAIPGRDCGGYSGGGQPDSASYQAWIDQIAAGIDDSDPIAIIEPDSLSLMSECDVDRAQRFSLIRYAVRKLTKAGAWTYIDAGHSAWTEPSTMAKLLKKASVAKARGFATNVANYRPMGAEKKYATAINAALAKLGITGRRYVVDTGRNGARPPSNEWCNPSWARIGKAPKLVFDGAFDGRLWVKNPGESDGPCNGGPTAGQWWDAGARNLLGK